MILLVLMFGWINFSAPTLLTPSPPLSLSIKSLSEELDKIKPPWPPWRKFLEELW